MNPTALCIETMGFVHSVVSSKWLIGVQCQCTELQIELQLKLGHVG